MHKLVLLCLIVLCLVQPASAEAELPFGVSLFDFGGVFLGQVPDDDMICTRGPCFSLEESEIPESRQYAFSVYKKPLDITHYGKVEIAAPQYFFFENQLFQILIKIQCEADEVESCLERITAKLHEDYPLIKVESQARSGLWFKAYRTESGTVVQVSRREATAGETSSPIVKIFDEKLMDTVRSALNPNYVPLEYR